LAIAGIYLTTMPELHYGAELFEERQVRSVTANTRRDGVELLDIAVRVPIEPTVRVYPFERADDALTDLAADQLTGAAVLLVEPAT
jgi:propanol-preferring alcohol dehydrogenase